MIRAKEISMSQLGVGLNSQQQVVSIVAPTSSDRRLAAAFGIASCQAAQRKDEN
jgi:hypothetical protein